MGDDAFLLISGVVIILSLIWHRVAGIVGLLICMISIWTLSEQLHYLNTGASENVSGLGGAFIGLLFILRYRMKRPNFNDRTYETNTGTYFPASGTVVRNYSTGFGRAFATTVIGGMIIIVILAALLSVIRFSA
ncbi:MAG: hypothetical protein R3C51_11235 [Parvularculaceae bacterium]